MQTAHELAGPLLGRDSEVALITSLLDGISSSGGRALLLRGEPGIGKSRLLLKAADLAGARGMATLSTAGAQAEAQLGYTGLHRLLRPVRDRAAFLPPSLGSALRVAIGAREELTAERFRVAMAVLDLLSELAADTPLLVTVDDAHWVDRASSDVLAFVARRLEFDPIVLLAAATGKSRVGLTGASLPELRLRRLDPAAAARLLQAQARGLDEVEQERILREAAGNPLALIELPKARAGFESEPLPGLIHLTDRLERSFAARTSDLPAGTRLLLLVVSLLDGDDVEEVTRAASNAAGRPIGPEALEVAVEAGMIELDLRTVRFRHPLMRSAVRQSASVAQRRRVHEALAEMLASKPDRRVWHRAALITGEHESIAAELEQAGRRASRRGMTGEAFSAMRRAAELSGPRQRGRRLLSAAQLAYELGQLEGVVPILHEAEQLEPGPADRSRITWIEELMRARPIGTAERAGALIKAAEDAGTAGDREIHMELLLLVAMRSWWAGARPGVGDLLRGASDRLGGADASDLRAVAACAYADPLGRATAVLGHLKVAAAERGHSTDAARYLSEAALVIGAFDLAIAFLAEAVDGLRREGRLGPLARTLALYGLVAARLANWDIAIPAAEESSRLATEFREPLGAARADTVLSTIAGMRGDVQATEQAAARAEQVGTAAGSHATVAFAQFGRVLAALGTGQHADAYCTAKRLFDPADPAHHPSIAPWLVSELAEAAVHIDQIEDARGRIAEVEAAAGHNPPVWIALSVRHARAVLSQTTQEAERRFAQALGADLTQWPFQRARLQLGYGQWLRRQRRIAESRDPLRRARDTFDALDCSAWSDKARQELRASGESSRQRNPAARDRLTPQELQISTLAAEGLSNREIAERLYLSPRTVSTHLYRVFPKLGISGRAELRDALSPGRPAT